MTTISYILIEPTSLDAIPGIKSEIDKLGYVAVTQDEFMDESPISTNTTPVWAPTF